MSCLITPALGVQAATWARQLVISDYRDQQGKVCTHWDIRMCNISVSGGNDRGSGLCTSLPITLTRGLQKPVLQSLSFKSKLKKAGEDA